MLNFGFKGQLMSNSKTTTSIEITSRNGQWLLVRRTDSNPLNGGGAERVLPRWIPDQDIIATTHSIAMAKFIKGCVEAHLDRLPS